MELGGQELVMETIPDRNSIYDGLTVLHCACKNKASTEVIVKMIELGGRQLVMQTTNKHEYDDGITALHYACRYNALTEVILKMIQLGGRTLIMKRHMAMTALHYACANKASIEVIILLVLVGGRKLVMKKAQYGKTALHYAHRYHAPRKVIMMLERFNDSTTSKTNEKTKEIIKDSIEGMTIAHKRSLLHLAIKNGLKWSIATNLVESNVDYAVYGHDCSTGLRLFMIAAMGDNYFSDLSSIYGLMRMSPSTS